MKVDYTSLILKSLEDNLSDKESIFFDQWLSNDENNFQYQKLKNIWETSGTLTYPEIEAQLNIDEAFDKVLKRTRFISTHTKSRKPFLIAACAILLVVVLGYLSLNLNSSNQYTTIYAEANMKYTLPDNSTVWLSKDSELSYHNDFANNRKIRMEGKVMYEVTHDPQNPFVIDAESMDVSVLGTKFIVSNSEGSSDYVHVINGKVQVDDKKGNKSRTILTKDMTTTRTGNQLVLSDITIANEMFWASNSLSYNNTSLDIIFDELESYFDTEIKTKNQFSKCKFNGTFTGDKIEDILSTLEVIYELEIKKSSGTITISGPSCK